MSGRILQHDLLKGEEEEAILLRGLAEFWDLGKLSLRKRWIRQAEIEGN